MGRTNTRPANGQREEGIMHSTVTQKDQHRHYQESPRYHEARLGLRLSRAIIPVLWPGRAISIWKRSVDILQGKAMTRVEGFCKRCVPAGRMHRTYDYNLKIRLVRLLVPVHRVRCDKCGQEGWAWKGGWTELRQGEMPPGILVAISIVTLLIAFYLAR